MLLSQASPVEQLFDQYELFAHWGQAHLINLNVALGTMEWKVPGTVAQIKPGMEYFIITKHVVMMAVVVALVSALFLYVRFAGKTTAKGAPRGLWNFLEPILLFIRDEIARPMIKDPHHHGHGHGDGHDHAGEEHGGAHGHHDKDKPTHRFADRMLPLLVTLFFFIAGMNLLGLIPGSSTPTSSISITLGLALITLLVYLIGGMFVQRPFLFGFFKNLTPACPVFVWPILFIIEFAGAILIKPVALTIRLFANMTAGHCLLIALATLAISAYQGLGGVGLGIGALTTLMSAAIYCMEVFVALVQAYIFTFLTALFIGMYLAPEH